MSKLSIFLFVCFFHRICANPSCPPGTKPSINDPNICFLFKETPKSFNDSEADCVAAGGHLTPIFDQITNLLVALDANEAFKNSPDFWIGGKLTEINSASIWLWIWNDSILKFSDWTPGESVKNQNGSCISVTAATALWKPDDCKLTKSYVCRLPPKVCTCEDGWAFLEKTQMCYKMFSNKSWFNWIQGNEMCQNQNATIISIHNNDENTLLGKLTTLGTPQNWQLVGVWIGLIYSNSTWIWTDGTPFDYPNWGSSDPDAVGTSNCVLFYPDGATDGSDNNFCNYIMQWDTAGCNDTVARVVCKKSPTIVPISENP